MHGLLTQIIQPKPIVQIRPAFFIQDDHENFQI